MRTATVIALMLLPAVAGAQGTRSAALHGAVTTATGEPIADALVRVINTSNGQRWERMTGLVGRFQFEDLAVGGPYRIEVRAVGFGPQVGDGIMLTLGTRTRADIQLRPAAVQLPAVVSTARRREVLDASLSGPSTVLSSAEIARLPNVGRDFLRLTTLSPFAAYSPSSGGSPTGGII